MKTIYIRGGGARNGAVEILRTHLEERGHEVVRKAEQGHDRTVCWGISTKEIGALNSKVNQFNKFEAMLEFHHNRVPAPIVFDKVDLEMLLLKNREDIGFPWLARKFTHRGGTDIVTVTSFQQAMRMAVRDECDFFSVFILTQTEFRVWVFQNDAFAIYEKQWKGEGEFIGIQRNRHFGFTFVKRDDLRDDEEKLTGMSIAAVKALNMDFGAVDVILGKDGQFYVLEVNTMPNIDSVERSSGIRLAKRISQWAENNAE
jgi:hypothetical protein